MGWIRLFSTRGAHDGVDDAERFGIPFVGRNGSGGSPHPAI
jgi:hypothetical protein